MKRNISWRDLPRFKIDEEQKLLYWDDEVIHTSAVLHLSNKQGIVALIVSVATILSAIFSGITTFGLYTNKEDKERQDTASRVRR